MTARPIDRVLDTLRRQIAAGARPAGQLLPVAELSQALGVSATPVREALAHLAGEGLVEDSRGRGYVVRQLTESDYRAACDLHARLLHAGLDWRAPAPPGASQFQVRLGERRQEGADVVEATAWLFEAIVASSGNTALAESYRRLSDRLGAARRAEAALLDHAFEELEELARSLDSGDRLRVDARFGAYHTRRRAAADLICEHLRRQLKSDPIFRA